MNLIPGSPWQNSIQQADALHQQIEIKYKEETSEVLHMELDFVRS
jgi:hypothetical protein